MQGLVDLFSPYKGKPSTSSIIKLGLLKMFVPEVRRFVPTVSIVEDDYCYPYLVDLAVNKTVGFSSKHVCAFDGNGNLLVQVVGAFWQFKKKRTMYNSFGVPIITMRRKVQKLKSFLPFIFSSYIITFTSPHDHDLVFRENLKFAKSFCMHILM